MVECQIKANRHETLWNSEIRRTVEFLIARKPQTIMARHFVEEPRFLSCQQPGPFCEERVPDLLSQEDLDVPIGTGKAPSEISPVPPRHLDFIVEWLCGVNKTCRFRVAPAVLRFANVDNLRLDVSLEFKQPIEIYSVERSALPDKRFENWRWRILIVSYPEEKQNVIEFDATGFSQELTGNPVETDAQYLTQAEREQAIEDWRTTH